MIRRASRLLARAAWLCSAAVLLLAPVASADTLDVEATEPPRSFAFTRGADPVPMVATVRYHLTSGETAQLLFTIQDQDNKPLATRPLPAASVKRGRGSVTFRTSVGTLDPRVKRVVLSAVLIIDVPGTARVRPPSSLLQDSLTYKVK